MLADEVEELEAAELTGGRYGSGGGAAVLHRLKCCLTRVTALLTRWVARGAAASHRSVRL